MAEGNKILVVDIETTGFSEKTGSIVEIGAVDLDLDNGEITEVFSSLCREKILSEKHRDAWIFNNSDLTFDEVWSAPPFEQVAAEFQKVMDAYPKGIAAYNRRFDFTFLASRRLKLPRNLPCPMLVATDVCRLPGSVGKYKWPKVEEAFAHLFPDVPYKEKHRGADDARHEAMIVYKLYRLGHFKI